MPYIDVVRPEDADGKLEKLYQKVRGPEGQVDHVLQVHSLRPHTLEGHMALYRAVLHHPGNTLSLWFLEAVGVLVSRLNGCEYCDRHHTSGLRRALENNAVPFEDYDQALAQPNPGAPFSPEEQAALGYAAKLTHTPSEIEQADIDYLKEQGMSDGEILELNQVTSYFAYANRTVSGLGVSVEGEKLGLSPQSGKGDDAWRHD